MSSTSLSTAPLGPLNLTGEQHFDVLRTIHVIAQSASDAQIAIPVMTEAPTEYINYEALKTEHAELLKQGKTSLEITGWLGEKLNISAWKEGKFHGERKVLSTPTGEEMTRLQKFTQALGISWSKANGGSDNHPDFLLLDGYVQNSLFGGVNMQQAKARLNKIHADWKNLETAYVTKTQYLKEKFGLDIRGDWSKLTGVRTGIAALGVASAYLVGGCGITSVCLSRAESDVLDINPHTARLCFLT